jgi:hypothetical protein
MYNPSTEAEKYAASLELRDGIAYFILVEPALGYIAQCLRKKNTAAKIICLHLDSAFIAESVAIYDGVWHEKSALPLQTFLEKNIPDTESEKIKIIEWRPSLNAFGILYENLIKETARFIKRSDANKRTTKSFEKRWERNIKKNINSIKNIVQITNDSAFFPCIVLSAGPSLDAALHTLLQDNADHKIIVIAVSSAAHAVLCNGIMPDIIVTTDGGNWARWHIVEIVRHYKRNKNVARPLIAASISAALFSEINDFPVWFHGDDGSCQKKIFDDAGIPQFHLPQRGTVTAAALDIALFLTKGSIYLSGADLESRDIASHTRNYAFETLFFEKENRLNTHYNQKYERFENSKNGSLSIYADWFKAQNYPKNIFSFGNNTKAFNFPQIHSIIDNEYAVNGGLHLINNKEKLYERLFLRHEIAGTL